MNITERVAFAARCIRDFGFFCSHACQVLDTQSNAWLPFELWEAQKPVAALMQTARKLVVLKARQLGLSWMADALALHQSLFHPHSQVLLYSYRDEEAKILLTRLTGMYERLPESLRFRDKLRVNAHECTFPNGSKVRSLPTTAGDSYTANLVVIDEADMIRNLNTVLRRVQPTIDNGGRLLLVSRANKDYPESTFKRIYRASVEGANDYGNTFLPWSAHPRRDASWYNAQRDDIVSRTGATDDLYELYPETPEQALAARVLSTRYPADWVSECADYVPETVDVPEELRGLTVWENPVKGRKYLIAADVAEGGDGADESGFVVLDDDGVQVAEYSGRIDLGLYAELTELTAAYYNKATVFVERNNHGHAIILKLRETVPKRFRLGRGRDGKLGHLTDAKGKALMHAKCADRLRDRGVKIRSRKLVNQLLSIDRATLSAPPNMRDDLATAFAIACVGLERLHIDPGSFALV